MTYEVIHGERKYAGKGVKWRDYKKQKSKAQRIAGKKIIKFYQKGEINKSESVVIDPKCGWVM